MKRTIILFALTWTCLPGYVRAQNPVVVGGPFVRVAVVDVEQMYEKNARYRDLREKFFGDLGPFRRQTNELESTIAYWRGLLLAGKLKGKQKDEAIADLLEASRVLEDLDVDFKRKSLRPFAQDMNDIHDEITSVLDELAVKKRWHMVIAINRPFN